MFYGADGTSPTYANSANSRIVTNPDPENPVVMESQDLSSGETFMTLMLEQLKNQDPMNPADSNAMTQQLAALNTVEQLISMNSTMTQLVTQGSLADATALIGSNVEGIDGNNDIITGVVDHVEIIEDEPTLIVGDQLLLLDQIVSVSKLDATDESTTDETTVDDLETSTGTTDETLETSEEEAT